MRELDHPRECSQFMGALPPALTNSYSVMLPFEPLETAGLDSNDCPRAPGLPGMAPFMTTGSPSL